MDFMRFCRRVCSLVVVLVACSASLADEPAGATVVDEECGVEVVLPAADWKLLDASQGPAKVRIYSPAMPPVPRFTLMLFPAAAMPEGLRTRAVQLKALVQADIAVTQSAIAGEAAERIEYVAQGTRSVEYGLKRGDNLLIIQVVATEADWKDEAKAPAMERIIESVRFRGAPAESAPIVIDPATPAEVRAARAALEPEERPFAIRRHDVTLVIEPSAKSLRVRDQFEVEVLAEQITELLVHVGDLTIDAITAGERPCKWSRAGEHMLRIELPEPAGKGERLSLHYEAHSDDYFFAFAQQLVAEVEMLGQVREKSTYSSHVLYYPVDPRNDAPVKTVLDVPKGLTAVTGGDFHGSQEQGDRVIFRYEMSPARPRLLPLGFAVGDYRMLEARTPGGLELALYHFPDSEAPARQRMDIAVKAGTLFERLMGPLPWKRVAFCQVRPERRETGVSLPGQVLMSDGFFGDISGLKLRGAGLNDRRVLGALIVVDELAHQWNAYATPLPNELAEGISTFSNLLYIEAAENADEYRAGVKFCTDAYLMGMAMAGDVALAHPKLYASPCYRTVAFTKPPAVLHMLRMHLGDERFFRGWREAFENIRDPQDAYAAFQKAFEQASGEQLGRFFDDWFFRAGVPHVELEWKSVDAPAAGIELLIRQKQEQEPYDFIAEVALELESGAIERKIIRSNERETRVIFEIPGPVRSVRLDPDGLAPIRIEKTGPAGGQSTGHE